MIDGPRRTALEEMHAARLAEEKRTGLWTCIKCKHKWKVDLGYHVCPVCGVLDPDESLEYFMSVDPANFNDTVEPVPYYPGINRTLHEGYRWEPEKQPGQLIPLPTCSECGKRPVHVITDVFHLEVCEYCLIKKLKETPPLNAYANVNRATYPRWKLSSDWKRPSRWQRLRWRIRSLCRRVGAWFRWRGWWWAEEDE